MALALLLAVLAQPAWAIAHVLVHDHLAHHAHHQGDALGHHDGATHAEGHGADPRDADAPRLTGDAHRHDHEHLDATFVPPARSADEGSLAGIPATGPRWTAPPLQRLVHSEGRPSRASPDPPDASRPRAPPHA